MTKSEWTVASLKEHYDQRFLTAEKSVDQRFDDSALAISAALISADKAVAAALNAAKEAVVKAEVAQEKRMDASNEFRGQLADQAATFMPRAEAEIRFSNLLDKVDANTSNIDRSSGGSDTGHRLLGLGLAICSLLVSAGAIIAVIIVSH